MSEKTKKGVKLTVPATASMWYILTNIFSKGIGFAFTPIFTRLMTAEEYGVYSLYISWSSIFTVICTLEMHGSIAYRGLAEWQREKSRFVSAGFGAILILSLGVALIYILFAKQINDITGLSTPLTLILILQVLLNAGEGLYLAEKRYSYKYKTVSILSTAIGLLTPIISIIMINLGALGSGARIISPLIVSLLIVTPMISSSIKRAGTIYDPAIWKYLFRYSIHMLPHYIALSLVAQGDKIIISRLLGADALGKYHIAYSIAFIIVPITSGIASALTPWITRKAKMCENARVGEAIEGAFGIATILVLMLFAIMPEVFRIIGGEKFYSALTSVYPIGVGAIFLFMSGILSSYILCYTTPRVITVNTVVAAASGLSSTVILVPRIGIIGGGIGTLISYFMLFALNYATAARVTKSRPMRKSGLILNTLLIFSGAVTFAGMIHSPASRIILLIALVMIFLQRARGWGALLLEGANGEKK